MFKKTYSAIDKSMQNLNVFPEYISSFPFQCEFSSELGMGSKWKGKTNWQSKTLFLKIQYNRLTQCMAIDGRNYRKTILFLDELKMQQPALKDR